MPEPFNDSVPGEKVPDALRSFLEARGKTFDPNIIYVTCDGENPEDKENIGPVDILPDGFGFQYYPYTNSPGYLSPVVMVKLNNPKRRLIIHVECRAWAANIKHSRLAMERTGLVKFLIRMD